MQIIKGRSQRTETTPAVPGMAPAGEETPAVLTQSFDLDVHLQHEGRCLN